ncbi:hypothetical protein MUK42_34082 [Musa troglodytarum]|uniref:Uncharacterized protein n=1 Tax=Musa troglodytarum TaxID=320322 RepID=A0A9E7EFZ8_9LILI|nr:hypothetical protein MUK42_34082 [Musa troglodytarum]
MEAPRTWSSVLHLNYHTPVIELAKLSNKSLVEIFSRSLK